MKSALRNVIFYLHLAAGVAAGLVILIMSATGAALAFEQQILAGLNRSYGHVPGPGERALPVEQLLERARALKPGATVSNVTLYADPGQPALVSFGREGNVYLDPYTGAGGPAKGAAFFRIMTDWHRWLAMSGESRATGRAVTGASNLVFLGIVLSGLVLWFPNSWKWAAVKLHLVPSVRLRGKARDWNWHNALGFWALLPLVVIVVAGVVISYGWASDLVYQAAGEKPPVRSAAQSVPGPVGTPSERALEPTEPATRLVYTLEQAFETARGYSPGWNSISFAPPRSPEGSIAFTLDHGTGRQPQHKSTITIYPVTGERLFQTAAAQSPGRKLRSFFRFAHTGEYFGLVGQAIGLAACLAACVLVYTGLALAVRRGLNFVRARRARRAAAL